MLAPELTSKIGDLVETANELKDLYSKVPSNPGDQKLVVNSTVLHGSIMVLTFWQFAGGMGWEDPEEIDRQIGEIEEALVNLGNDPKTIELREAQSRDS